MKFIKDVKLKLAFKSLVANGTSKNISLKVGGNRLTIGEIIFVDNNKDTKGNISFTKEVDGRLEFSGNHDYKLVINNLTINGDGGQEFSVELLEFNCVTEAMELFASIMK